GPHRQVCGYAPDGFARIGIEAEELRFRVDVPDAAATVNALAGDGGSGVDVQTLEVPQFLARRGVEAIQAVIAGADEDSALPDHRAGLGMAGRLALPELRALGGIEAVDLAVRILMKALSDVELAIRQAGRGDRHRLHLFVIGERPDQITGVGVEAVNRSVRRR